MPPPNLTLLQHLNRLITRSSSSSSKWLNTYYTPHSPLPLTSHSCRLRVIRCPHRQRHRDPKKSTRRSSSPRRQAQRQNPVKQGERENGKGGGKGIGKNKKKSLIITFQLTGPHSKPRSASSPWRNLPCGGTSLVLRPQTHTRRQHDPTLTRNFHTFQDGDGRCEDEDRRCEDEDEDEDEGLNSNSRDQNKMQMQNQKENYERYGCFGGEDSTHKNDPCNSDTKKTIENEEKITGCKLCGFFAQLWIEELERKVPGLLNATQNQDQSHNQRRDNHQQYDQDVTQTIHRDQGQAKTEAEPGKGQQARKQNQRWNPHQWHQTSIHQSPARREEIDEDQGDQNNDQIRSSYQDIVMMEEEFVEWADDEKEEAADDPRNHNVKETAAKNFMNRKQSKMEEEEEEEKGRHVCRRAHLEMDESPQHLKEAEESEWVTTDSSSSPSSSAYSDSNECAVEVVDLQPLSDDDDDDEEEMIE